MQRKIIPLSALLLILLPWGVFPQVEQAVHPDSLGTLFIRQGEPVFLYLSTSPTGSNPVRLRSIESEDTLQWNGHGARALTHLDLFIGRRILFKLFVDGLPPRTTPQFDPRTAVQSGSIIYISGAAYLELSSADANSGVNQTYYSINGADYTLYTTPILMGQDGHYALTFYSTDRVGNREDSGTRTIVVDSKPPTTQLSFSGPRHNEVISGRTEIVLTATDTNGVASTLFMLGDSVEHRYNRPIQANRLPEGEHTITWQSVDILGNVEPKQSFTFFVDRTPPMVFEEISGSTYMVAGREFSSGRSQLRIVAVDNRAGVKEIYYSLNREQFQPYQRPIFLSDITGALSVRSFAEDNVGNRGTSDAQGQQFSMPEIDINGPIINHRFQGAMITLRDTIWVSPLTRVQIQATDRGSGVSRIVYKLNDDSGVEYSEPFTVASSGYYQVSCTAWDNVDNLNIAKFGFGVDAQSPHIFHNFSVAPHGIAEVENQPLPVFSPNVKLYLGATDNLSGIKQIMVSVNQGRERAYSSPLDGFRVGHNHTVSIRATDMLGNQTTQSISFRVE